MPLVDGEIRDSVIADFALARLWVLSKNEIAIANFAHLADVGHNSLKCCNYSSAIKTRERIGLVGEASEMLR